MKKEEYNYKPEFANWNKFYDDLFTEIAEIRLIGNKALFDTKNTELSLNLYYSRIQNLYSTHSHFINDTLIVGKELQRIEDFLFSDKYLSAVRNKNLSIFKTQRSILIKLRNIFTLMCASFSSNGISVKVIGVKRRDPSKAILEGYS